MSANGPNRIFKCELTWNNPSKTNPICDAMIACCSEHYHWEEMEFYLAELKTQIHLYPNSLFESTKNRSSLLDIALRIPFELIENNIRASAVACSVFDILVEKMKTYPDLFRNVLNQRARSGIKLVQQAVLTGSLELVSKVMHVFDDYPDLGTLQFTNMTSFSMTALMTALQLGNSSASLIIKKVEDNKEVLRQMLSFVSMKTKFTPLQSALRSGNIHNIKLIGEQLKKHPDLLEKALDHFTQDQLTPLHHAFASGNVEAVKYILDLYQHIRVDKRRRDILSKALKMLTVDNYNILSYAIISGSASLLEIAIQCYVRFDPNFVFLETRSTSGCVMLNHAIIAGNHENLIAIVILLQQKDKLNDNLNNITNNGFNIANSVCKAGSQEDISYVFDLIVEHLGLDALEKQLKFMNHGGFNCLDTIMNLREPRFVKHFEDCLRKHFKDRSHSILSELSFDGSKQAPKERTLQYDRQRKREKGPYSLEPHPKRRAVLR